jgi:hypothetical protein
LLLASNIEGAIEIRLRLGDVRLGFEHRDFGPRSEVFRPPTNFPWLF